MNPNASYSYVLIKLKVHPGSRKDAVVSKSVDTFEIFVRAKPVEGKANEAALVALSDFLNVPRGRLRLRRGSASRNKLVELIE